MEAKIKVPTNLNDISLGQYQMYQKVLDDMPDEPNVHELEFIHQKLISIMCNCSLAEVFIIKKTYKDELIEDLTNLLNSKATHTMRFKIKDTEFGMIPDFENMSYGEFLDLTNYVNDWQEMHKAMAVLYRPITEKKGEKYLIDEYRGTDDHKELMKHMPLGVVLGAMVFFYNLTKELAAATLHYSEEELREEILSLLHNSQESGVDIPASTLSLADNMIKLNKLPEQIY